ncbi:MAG: class I SAM-dependent methyltransferase [Deltaproteobacteria bacterium]|nr:class I SAM-dependent methyltransferase [Deltaproteobacteria bacterium]MBW1983746.1 class I SAM-dependent methyltransferase [Deltaproteobacteria bacterium]
MPYLPRIPEGQEVDENALNVFSRVARWGGFAAAKRIQKILGSHLSTDMTVLDVGTGPASIPLYLKRFFPTVGFTGIDISVSMLEKAKENRKILDEKIGLLASDGELLPFRPNSIDVVTSFFVLHHIDSPGRLLNEIDRVLKPNGVFLSIDFRRDMPRLLFHTLNTLWQSVFFFSSGRFGIRDSIRASWSSVEIDSILVQNNLNGFKIHVNPMELWIYRGL